jgi:hypothetical protein
VTNQPAPEAPLVLAEHDSALVQLTIPQALELRRFAAPTLIFVPGDTAGTWQVTSASYAGTVTVPGIRVLIAPKVQIGTLLYLLEASGRPVAAGPADFSYGTIRELVPAFATFYAGHLERALARGIPRAYHEAQERQSGHGSAPARARARDGAVPRSRPGGRPPARGAVSRQRAPRYSHEPEGHGGPEPAASGGRHYAVDRRMVERPPAWDRSARQPPRASPR